MVHKESSLLERAGVQLFCWPAKKEKELHKRQDVAVALLCALIRKKKERRQRDRHIDRAGGKRGRRAARRKAGERGRGVWSDTHQTLSCLFLRPGLRHDRDQACLTGAAVAARPHLHQSRTHTHTGASTAFLP